MLQGLLQGLLQGCCKVAAMVALAGVVSCSAIQRLPDADTVFVYRGEVVKCGHSVHCPCPPAPMPPIWCVTDGWLSDRLEYEQNCQRALVECREERE